MVLIAIWILESAIFWAIAARVLADSLATLKYLQREQPALASSYAIDPARDWLILAIQTVNVLVGLLAAVSMSAPGLKAPIGILTLVGFMLLPALIGWISLKTYRHRHPGPK